MYIIYTVYKHERSYLPPTRFHRFGGPRHYNIMYTRTPCAEPHLNAETRCD